MIMADDKSKSLAKRNTDTGLMLPPPQPKRQKRPAKVVDEDIYSDALSHIIARDFFPGLLETEAQNEYMQALESSDKDWIRDAGRRLTQAMTPGPEGRRRAGTGTRFTPRTSTGTYDTPRGFQADTPGATPSTLPIDGSTTDKASVVDVNMSLGAFQAKYTSEDNESFNALLDKQNEKRAAKYAFFHTNNKIPSARQIAHRERERKLLENKGGSSTALTTTNSLGEEVKPVASSGPSQDLDARPASVNSFTDRQGPRNSLMFGPDGVEDHLSTDFQRSEERSNAPPRAIQYAATRLPAVSDLSAANAIPPSPSMSAIDAAISGRPRPTDSEPGYTGAETPRVNGYAFVDAEPTPSELGVPVTDEEADEAEREAAMKLLPEVDKDGPNPFRINERSQREDLHMRLVEQADSKRRKGGRLDQMRGSASTPGRTLTPKFKTGVSLKKSGGMTPAAQRLAERIGTPKREGNVFEKSNTPRTNRWTPMTTNKKRP